MADGDNKAGAASKDDDVLATAKKRYQYAVERQEHNRSRQKEDIKFAAASPDDPWQWDSKTLQARKSKERPALTINKLPLHIRQVTNDIRQNRPQIRYRPADNKSDPQVADILNGMVRHIEAHSQADMAYDSCVVNQVTHGEGFIRILSDYVSEQSFDQDIFIRRVDDPFRVKMDPDIQDWTGSDAKWCFVDDRLSEEDFKREYPDADPIDWNYAKDSTWFCDDKHVLVAEYFEVVEQEAELLMFANGATMFKGDEKVPEGVMLGEQPIKRRKSCRRKVIWRTINGQQVLKEQEFPSKYIPIVRAVGNQWTVDGKTYISGIVRNAKDSQRMYNAAQSAIVERVLLAPKAPWVAPVEAINGYDSVWKTANSEPHHFLPYNHVDESGNPIPAPQRTQAATVETGLNQIAMGASDDIKAETGQFDASLGQKSNETSGRAIMARQREGDTATFHYVDNFGQCVRQAGVIILDMMPRIYDTKRVAKILGEDGDMATAVLDPQSPEAVSEFQEQDGAIGKIFNPNVGFYDVYTTSGPSFTTRRVEAAEAMTALLQASPELWSVIGDQFVKAQDWPGAEEMAERLKTVLRPEVRQTMDAKEGGGEVPPQLQAAIEQMQQQMQAMQESGAQLQAENEKLKQDQQDKGRELLIKAYEAETKRIQAIGGAMGPEQVQALVMQTLQQVLGTPDPSGEEAAPLPPIMAEPPPEMALMEQQQPPSGGFSLAQGQPQ